jgi:sugar O-acyltransferase (sialic acid O-acetyltransferase NeuD family)
MTGIILIGGGGHCRSCIDVIEAEGKYQIFGIVCSTSGSSYPVSGYPIVGCDHDLNMLLEQVSAALITVGQIKNPDSRLRLFNLLKSYGALMPVIKSPSAYCSRRASIGEGSILMHGSVVNTNVTIGMNCIINSQALIDHDAQIGDHCHISTGARVNGSVRIGRGSFIGSGAVLREGITVGDYSVIGGGSFVRHDVPAACIFRGVYG